MRSTKKDGMTDAPETDSAKILAEVTTHEEAERHRRDLERQADRKRESLPFLFPKDMGDIESTAEELIERYLRKEEITLLYAPKDMYKSFVSLDWGLCVATGKAWMGFKSTQGHVAFVIGEGARGYHKRIRAWCNRYQQDFDSLPITVTKQPMQVLQRDSMDQWERWFDVLVNEVWGAPPALVVVDTLSTNFGGEDENQPTQMAAFLAEFKIRFRAKYHCAVLIVHHCGKDVTRGARGGSAIEADSDTVYFIRRQKDAEGVEDDDPNAPVQLVCKHLKDDAPPPVMVLEPEVVEIGTNAKGRMLTSLVMKRVLTDEEMRILELTNEGTSQRTIASMIGKDKKHVYRAQKRLRELNVIGANPCIE